MGDDTVTIAAAMTPTNAPVTMNDQIRGARRMVTSVLVMWLFSQSDEGHEFGQCRTGAGGAHGTAGNGGIPGLVTNGERHERRRIEFDDVRRSSSRMAEPLDDLNGTVRRDADFDGFSRRDACEFLKDKPHGDCGGVPIARPCPNFRNRGSAAFGVDTGKGHAQHASSGKGRVFT